MTDETLSLGMDLVARDEASPAIHAVQTSLSELQKQIVSMSKAIRRSLGEDFVRAIGTATSATTKFATDATAGLTRTTTAVRAEIQAVNDLAAAYRGATQAQQNFNRGAGRGGRGGAGGRPPAPPRGTVADLRAIRQRWSIRERSAKAEVAEIATAAKAEATRQKAALDHVARTWRLKQASERAELRHLGTVRREQQAMRREMQRSAHEAMRHGEHAVRSINHPAHESIGRALTVGAAVGTAGAVESVRHDENLDSWLTQYRITTKQSLAEIRSVRREALHEANQLGIDPAEIVKLRVQSIRDGLLPELSRVMPKLSAMAAQAMGGSVEEDGEELSRAVKDAQVVGWVRDQKSARSTMNKIVGLSTFEGNSPLKMKQALANGLISRGKEVGWSENETFAAATALNSSGERTGTGTARLLAQIPGIRAGLFDRWRKAAKNPNTEENRAIVAAPRALGYRGIRDMENAFKSPKEFFELLYRLGQMPEKQRALTEKGLGMDEQFNPIIAEAGADHGKKYLDAKRKADQLSGQDESNDELEQAYAATRSSLSNIIGRIRQGWITLSDEVGDTIKTDILSPLSDWWGEISDGILDGDLGAKAHTAISAFIEGLGFKDFAEMLHAISGSARGFNAAEFFRGLGEGIRSVVDTVRSVTSMFGFMGNGSARTIGKIAAELLGLSIALRVISPLVTLIGGVASGIRAIGAAASAIRLMSGLGGVAAAAGEGGLIAAAVTTFPITLAAIAAGLTLSVVVMNWDSIKEWFFGSKDKPEPVPSASTVGGEIRSDVLKSVPPALRNDPSTWGKFLSPSQIESMQFGPAMPKGGPSPSSVPTAPEQGLMQLNAYQGGEDPNNWRNLLTRASYEPSDAGHIARDATVETARGVVEVRDAVDRLAHIIRESALNGVGGIGSGGGGAQNPSAPNIRYGRQHMGRGGSVGAGPGDMGGQASAMKGDEGQRAQRAMAKLMSLGWSKEAAAAAVGNAQQESGVRSDGPLGDTKRFGFGDAAAHGMFQWRDQRFRDLKVFAAKKGTNWKDFDTQIEFFDQESKKYGSESWRKTNNVYEANTGMKRFEGYGDKSFGTRLANARQILAGKTGGGFYPSQGQTVDSAQGGGGAAASGDAAGLALSLQGQAEGGSSRALNHFMHPGEWCADFINGVIEKSGGKGSGSAMAESFAKWGKAVTANEVKRGDVILENAHGRRINHVGMATGNVQRDRDGNVTAIEMISGNYGHVVRKNWERLSIIAGLRRGNQAIVDTANKLKSKIRSDEKASAAPSAPDIAHRIHRTKQPQGSTVNNTTADNSNVNHFHIHGAHDSHHVAKTVAAMLDRKNTAYHDQHESV